MDNWKFTTILWKVPDIHAVTQITWTVISGFLFITEKHWRSYLIISTWNLNHLAGKSRLKLIKIRKSKGDQTVEKLLYYFVQYFERKSLCSSRCYKLWLCSLMKSVRCHKRCDDQWGNFLICWWACQLPGLWCLLRRSFSRRFVSPIYPLTGFALSF